LHGVEITKDVERAEASLPSAGRLRLYKTFSPRERGFFAS
jgi:hypothetical protein